MSKNDQPSGMLLSCVGASEAIDKIGEQLIISGCDDSEFTEGRGLVNYEHQQPGEHNHGEEMVGRVVYSKKIFKASDCEDKYQKKYWNDIKLPFIYCIVRLFDEAGSAPAQAIAAQIRDAVKNNDKILARWSVEGSVLEKDGHRLTSCLLRRLTLTTKPCNTTCNTILLSDPNAPKGFEKNPNEVSKDILDDLVAEKAENPEHIVLGRGPETELTTYEEPSPNPLEYLTKLMAYGKLAKAMAAGFSGGSAPSSLTGGAALSVESIGSPSSTNTPISGGLSMQTMGKKKKRNIYSTSSGFDKSELHSFVKDHFPDMDDESRNQIVETLSKHKLKKSEPDLPRLEALVVELNKAVGDQVIPGMAYGGGKNYHVLSEQPLHYIARGNEGLVKLPKESQGTDWDLKVISGVTQPSIVDGAVHGSNLTPQQHSLVHGLDLSYYNPERPSWHQTPTGPAFIQISGTEHAFYDLAKKFWHLEQYLPLVAAVTHPTLPLNLSVIAPIPNAQHPDTDSMGQCQGHQLQIIKVLGDSGELDKLAIMDIVMGNNRTDNNVQFTLHSEPYMRLTDNNDLGLLNKEEMPDIPPYLIQYSRTKNQPWETMPFHDSALEWLKQLDFNDFEKFLTDSGLPPPECVEALRRLLDIQTVAQNGMQNKGQLLLAPWKKEITNAS